MAAAYTGLNRAQLSYDYLHTNSTTHEFLFGALAELVDNARDANASKLDIFTVPDRTLRGGFMLCFQDDGEGMDPSETANVITFGRSIKKGMDSTLIGQYGNGLKSGSMRIGNDVILFTKKETTMTCLMLSRTFHEEEKIKEVIVPLPSFLVQNHTPILEGGRKGNERHDMEMELILKYSPFHTRDEFFHQFRRISGISGTIVIVYNLKLLDSGITELDFKTDPNDILLTGTDLVTDRRLVPERHSFRAYTAILYLEPRMKVFIQGKKVQAHRYIYNLYKPRCYQYTSARFKARSKDEAKRAELEVKTASMKLKEAEGRARELEKNFIASPTNKDGRMKLRAAQKVAEERQEDVRVKTAISERKQKALKEPKSLTFNFGLNLENRKCDGLFIYNCNRLIKMYERIGPQLEGNSVYRGIVVIINVPYIVLEPTHNKQDFADAKEYRHLLKVLGEHMEQYCRDLGNDYQDSKTFWEEFGYVSSKWTDSPSGDFKYANRRAKQIKFCIQCDTCLKWRVLPYASANVGKQFPDNWVCLLNQDSSRNRCSAPEEKLILPEGKFQKAEKSKADKQENISGKIKRLQSTLKDMARTESVMSSLGARRTMDRVAKRQLKRRSSHKKGRQRRGSANTVSTERSESEQEEEDEQQDEPEDEQSEEEMEQIEEDESRSTLALIRSPRLRLGSTQSNSESPPRKSLKRIASPPLTVREAIPEPVAKRPRRESQIVSETETVEESLSWPEDSEGDSGEDNQSGSNKYVVGTRVEVQVKGKWHLGNVIKVNQSSGQVRVKFEKHPDDRHDKTISVTSQRLKCAPGETSPIAVSSQAKTVQDSLQHEMPSSSTCALGPQNGDHFTSLQDEAAGQSGSGTVGQTSSLLDEVSRGYRTCLHYFLPPQWIMDKDVVNSLTSEGLASFPLDDFFDNYEKGLRKLVSGFQQEATMARQEAEKAQSRLTHTSRLIARLLNSIHDECNLDPDQDINKVDELLQACVLQAEMASAQTDQVTTSCS